MVPFGDSNALAAAFEEIFSNPEGAREMGRNARAFVEPSCRSIACSAPTKSSTGGGGANAPPPPPEPARGRRPEAAGGPPRPRDGAPRLGLPRRPSDCPPPPAWHPPLRPPD